MDFIRKYFFYLTNGALFLLKWSFWNAFCHLQSLSFHVEYEKYKKFCILFNKYKSSYNYV